MKFTTGGTAVCEVGLAVNRKWKDKSDKWQEEVTFVDVTLWGRTAEIAGEYLEKGKQVLIEGRLSLDQWDDRETGQKRSKLKVIGESMTMLGSGGKGSGDGKSSTRSENSESSEQGSEYSGNAPSGADEVPF